MDNPYQRNQNPLPFFEPPEARGDAQRKPPEAGSLTASAVAGARDLVVIDGAHSGGRGETEPLGDLGDQETIEERIQRRANANRPEKGYLRPQLAPEEKAGDFIPTPPFVVPGASERPPAEIWGNESAVQNWQAHKAPLGLGAYFTALGNERPAPRRLYFWSHGVSIEKTEHKVERKPEGRENTRGAIKGFSRWSRKRLMVFLSQIQTDLMGAPVFLSLTYHENWEGRDWKRDLDVYLKRVKRFDPGCKWVWRIETQKRGAPHYHLIIWGGERDLEGQRERAALCRLWHKIVDPGNKLHAQYGGKADAVTQYEKLGSYGKLFAYVAKYVAKCDDAESGAELGRRWGNTRDIPKNPEGAAWLSYDDDIALKRLFRRWIKARAIQERQKRQGKGWKPLRGPGYSKRYARALSQDFNCHMVFEFPLWVWRWLDAQGIYVEGWQDRPEGGGKWIKQRTG